MFNFKNYETEYLITLVISILKGEGIVPPKQELDMNRLFVLAKKQQLYCILLPALCELNLLNEEQKVEWNNYNSAEIQKTVIQNVSRSQICQELDNQKIKYMFLKGLVIREYYPKSRMRQMSDNDFLYDKSRQNDLIKLMGNLGFYHEGSPASNDFHNGLASFDFHKEVFNVNDDIIFHINLWDRAKKADDSSSRWIIDKNDNFIYSIFHMYKHYCFGGFGFRFLCDTYLLMNDEDLDWKYIDSQLKKTDYYSFAMNIIKLTKVLFNGLDADASLQELLDGIITGTVFGRPKTIDDKIKQKGGKLKYIISAMFPPKVIIYCTYPVTEKIKLLLPFFYIANIIKKLVRGKNIMKKLIAVFRSKNK